jgi:hypothetical protein
MQITAIGEAGRTLSQTTAEALIISMAQGITHKPEYWQGGGAFSHQYADGSAPFFVGGYSTAKDNSVYLPIVKGTSVTKDLGWGSSVSFGILRSGNGDFGSAVIHIIGDSGAGAIFSFDANGTFNTPAKINSGGALYAAGQIDSGVILSLVRVCMSQAV